jgi:WD40 repeat protein
MADIFISYSRHDSGFVHRIHNALQADGRDVWVDFEDIPPSAEWMKAIYAAIEAALAVVLVISPQSTASKICGDEVAHALAHNKRLIPILLQDVDQKLVPKAICDLNWILCRERDDFDVAVAKLCSAIDTDLAWVHAHTQLLTRAIEWDTHRRDKSFALRGSYLQGAEQLLTVVDKEPRLSPLQVEYVLRSRREENNRRSWLIGASGVAITVLIVIATLLALKNVENRRTLARDFREKAMRALANSDPVRAELYSARSLNLDDTQPARQFLMQARAKSARLFSVTPGKPDTAIIASTFDGAQFAIKGEGYVSLWDLKADRETKRLPSNGKKSVAAFSRDGRLIALAGERSIAIWPVYGNAGSIEFPAARSITSLAFDPGGHVLVSGANDGTLALWDLKSRGSEPVVQVRRHRHQISSLAFTADSKFLATGSWDNEVKLWSVAAIDHQPALQEVYTLVGHDDAVLSLGFSPDGKLIASGGWDYRILLWDRESGRQLRDLAGHNGGVLSLAFNEDGDRLASGSEDRSTRVWQVETGRPILQLPGSEDSVTAVTFSAAQVPHGIAIGDSTGAIRVWDLDTIGQRDELTTLFGHRRPVKTLAFNPKRAQLASGSWDRTVRLWNLNSHAATLLRDDADSGPTDSVTMVNFSADGNQLIEASKDGTLRLWNIDTLEVRILKPDVTSDPPIVRDVAFSPDGTMIVSGSDDGRVRGWSAATGKLLKDFAADPDAQPPKKLLAVAFSPDGSMLASAGEDKVIRLWKVADWTPAGTLTGHGEEIWQLVFSPNGELLLSASDDRSVRIWDVATLRPAGLLKHDAPVWGIDITADGHTVVTGLSDGTVHLWELAGTRSAVTSRLQTTMRFSDEPVWVVALNRNRDDPLLAIGGVDRAVRIVHLNRVTTLFNDRSKLEQDAKRNSGMEITDTLEPTMVPSIGPPASGAR